MSSETSEHFSQLIRAQITDGVSDSAYTFKSSILGKKLFGIAFHRKISLTGGAMTKFYIFTVFRVVT